MVGPNIAKKWNVYTETVAVLKARWTSQERKTQEHMETKSGKT